MFKKKFLSFIVWVLILVCSASHNVVKAFDDDFDFDMSSISLADLDAAQDAYYSDSAAKTRIPANLLAAILGGLGLQQPLWNSTFVPSGRDVLYLLPHKITTLENGGFAITCFFNMTDNMKVTVGDLVNFGALKANVIQDLLGSVAPAASPEEIEQLLPLFKKMTLQERKTGAMLQAGFIKGPITVQLNTSLQLGARNFWLSKSDRADIESVFPGEGIQESEFYKIRVGLGDTRVKIGLNTLNMSSFQNDIGLETIIPTSRFSYTPKLQLGVAEVVFDTDQLSQSALNALFAIRDNLLNPHLGNNGHFGLGCYCESKISVFHDTAQVWTRLSYDVLFPNDEDRLFLFRKTLSLSDLQGVMMDDQAGQDIVTDFIRQYVFPSSFKALVYPGGVVNFVTSITSDFNERFRGAIGYDFYGQQAESIKQIYNATVSLSDLDVDKAQTPRVYQHKIFSEIFYHKTVKKKDFGAALGGDVTVSSKNIGEDWTVYIKVAGSF